MYHLLLCIRSALYCLHIGHSSVFSSDTLCIVCGIHCHNGVTAGLVVCNETVAESLGMEPGPFAVAEEEIWVDSVADVFNTVTTVTVTGIAIVSKVSLSNKQADAYEQRWHNWFTIPPSLLLLSGMLSSCLEQEAFPRNKVMSVTHCYTANRWLKVMYHSGCLVCNFWQLLCNLRTFTPSDRYLHVYSVRFPCIPSPLILSGNLLADNYNLIIYERDIVMLWMHVVVVIFLVSPRAVVRRGGCTGCSDMVVSLQAYHCSNLN